MDDFLLQMRALWLVIRPLGIFAIVVVMLAGARFAAQETLANQGDKSRGWRVATIVILASAFALALAGSVDLVMHTINPSLWVSVFSGDAANNAHRRGWL